MKQENKSGAELEDLIWSITSDPKERVRMAREAKDAKRNFFKNMKVLGMGQKGGVKLRSSDGVEFERFSNGRITRLTDMGTDNN